jgi:hypothetical protein
LKFGVVVAMAVAHVAAWVITTDQKAVHTPNVDWQSQQEINFVFVLAAQAVARNLVAEHVDSLVGCDVKATVLWLLVQRAVAAAVWPALDPTTAVLAFALACAKWAAMLEPVISPSQRS